MPVQTDTDIVIGALTVRFHVDAEQSNGTAVVHECDVPPGAQTPAPHSHDGFEETIYGLRGVSTWTIAGRTVEVGPGDCVCIPRGVVHAFDNHAEDTASFLAIITPAVLGREYFEEIGALLASSAGPPDPAAVADLMRRHGLTPAAASS